MDRIRLVSISGLALAALCAGVIVYAVVSAPENSGWPGEAAGGGNAGFRPGTPSSAPETFTVRGMIRGENPGSATVTIHGAILDMTLSEKDGSFSFEGVPAGTYTVTPAMDGAAFSKPSAEVTVPSQAAVTLEFQLVALPEEYEERTRPVRSTAKWEDWFLTRRPASFCAFPMVAPPPPAPIPVSSTVPKAPSSSRQAPKREPQGVSIPARRGARDFLVPLLSDGNSRIRYEAALALGRLGLSEKKVVEALSAARKDEAIEVRSCAALALGMLRVPETAPVLVETASDKTAPVAERIHAAAAAGLCGEAHLPPLLGLANAQEKDVLKTAAMMGATLTGSEKAAYLLLSVLMGNNGGKMQAAATCCLPYRGERTLSTGSGRRRRTIDLGDLFRNRVLNKETRVEVRRALPGALARFNPMPEDVRTLVQALRLERDNLAKANCAVALGLAAAGLDAHDPEKAAALDALKLFADEKGDANDQACAVLGLGFCGAPGAGEALLSIFDGKGHPEVRAAAAIGLGLTRFKSAAPHLCDEVVRPRDGGNARGYAMLALGMIGDEAGLACLRAVLNDVRVPYLRWWAAFGLAESLDEESFEILRGMASDKNRLTREGAYRAIGQYRDDRALRALVERGKAEDRPELRAMLANLVGECAADPDRPLARLARAFAPDTLFSLGEAGMMLYMRR